MHTWKRVAGDSGPANGCGILKECHQNTGVRWGLLSQVISGTDAKPGLWETGGGWSLVPQTGLGPSVAVQPHPLLGFSCAQTLERQTCQTDGTAKQQVNP